MNLNHALLPQPIGNKRYPFLCHDFTTGNQRKLHKAYDTISQILCSEGTV